MQIDIVALMITALGTTLAIIGSNIALISWLRSDMKDFESEMKADTKVFESEMRADRKAFESEIRSWKDEIRKEMKDFHVKLCIAEERNKGK